MRDYNDLYSEFITEATEREILSGFKKVVKEEHEKEVRCPKSVEEFTNVVFSLRPGTGVQMYKSSTNNFYSVEKFITGDEWVWYTNSNTFEKKDHEDEEELMSTIQKELSEVIRYFNKCEIYAIMDHEGNRNTFRVGDRYWEDDEDHLGDYEKYGADQPRPEY